MSKTGGIGGEVTGLEGIQFEQCHRLSFTVNACIIEAVQVVCCGDLAGREVAAARSYTRDSICCQSLACQRVSGRPVLPACQIVQSADALDRASKEGWYLRIACI